jgi:hypothetical protein
MSNLTQNGAELGGGIEGRPAINGSHVLEDVDSRSGIGGRVY